MASIRKRTWTHAGETKSAWQVSYTDALSGRRATQQFQKKKEADAFRIKTEGEIASGERSQLIRASVAEVAERFIRFQELRVRDGLIGPERHGNVCRQIDFHIKPHLGKQIFYTLTAEDIDRWLKVIAAKGLGAGTVVGIRATFRLLERYAVKRHYAAKPIVAETLDEHGAPQADPIRTFTEDEMRRILAAANQRVVWGRRRGQMTARCFVHFATFCGLRYGEIAALKPENLDLDAGIVRVRASVTGNGRFKGPKTAAGVRDVQMPRHLIELVREYLSEYPVENEEGVLFCDSERRGPINHATFFYHWYRILYLAGIVAPELKPGPDGRLGPILRKIASPAYEKPHFHALRHFCASSWIANGVPLPDAAALLGHSKFDMTLRVYAHPLMTLARSRAVSETIAAGLLPSAAPMRQESDTAL